MPVYLSPGVYVEEFDSGPVPLAGGATALPAFVGFTEKLPTVGDVAGGEPDTAPRLVTSWSQYRQFYGDFGHGDWKLGHRPMLPAAVYAYFNNGGSSAFVVPIPWTQPRDEEKPELELASTDYYEAPDTNTKGIPVKDQEDKAALTVRSTLDSGEVNVSIQPGKTAPDDDTTFDMVVRVNGKQALALADLTVATAADSVAQALKDNNLDPNLLQVAPGEDAAAAVRLGSYPLVSPEPVPKADLKPADIEGTLEQRSGIASLQIHPDVTMLLVPDLYNLARFKTIDAEADADKKAAIQADWKQVDLTVWKDVQTMMITHCEGQTNRMAILDPPPNKVRADEIADWRSNTAMYDSQHAALYYPWLQIGDPVTGKQMFVPPSGHMAGIWAKVDSTRGVWKAPANEVVLGATGVQYTLTKGEHDLLNPIGINAVRPFGTRGIRVWGARTLSSNALWDYISVRRLFSWIEKTVEDGTQWVVFEPNDQTTWDRVTRTIANFLTGLWRDGALFGATPDQAFYVKCDGETNTFASIAEGKLICEVGIAPVKPAEFVVFRVTQWQPE